MNVWFVVCGDAVCSHHVQVFRSSSMAMLCELVAAGARVQLGFGQARRAACCALVACICSMFVLRRIAFVLAWQCRRGWWGVGGGVGAGDCSRSLIYACRRVFTSRESDCGHNPGVCVCRVGCARLYIVINSRLHVTLLRTMAYTIKKHMSFVLSAAVCSGSKPSGACLHIYSSSTAHMAYIWTIVWQRSCECIRGRHVRCWDQQHAHVRLTGRRVVWMQAGCNSAGTATLGRRLLVVVVLVCSCLCVSITLTQESFNRWCA